MHSLCAPQEQKGDLSNQNIEKKNQCIPNPNRQKQIERLQETENWQWHCLIHPSKLTRVQTLTYNTPFLTQYATL